VEGVTHEWTGSGVGSGDTCDLAKDRPDYWRSSNTLVCARVGLGWSLRGLSECVI